MHHPKTVAYAQEMYILAVSPRGMPSEMTACPVCRSVVVVPDFLLSRASVFPVLLWSGNLFHIEGVLWELSRIPHRYFLQVTVTSLHWKS